MSDSVYVRYLGEISFGELLVERKKRFHYSPDLNDFILYCIDGSVLSAGVETAALVSHQLFAVDEKRFQKHQHDIYIGARLPSNTKRPPREWVKGFGVEFHGWLTRAEVEALTPYLGYRSWPLSQLHSMDSLLAPLVQSTEL